MAFNLKNSFDFVDLTWFLPGIPWFFVIKKAHSTYLKYGFKKSVKILGELISIGVALTAIIFVGLAISAIVKAAITGEIHELLAEQSFSPEIILIGSSIVLGMYLGTGIYVFKKASKHYKQLTHSNPIGI